MKNYILTTLLFLFITYQKTSAQTCTGNADLVVSSSGTIYSPNNSLGAVDVSVTQFTNTSELILDLTDALDAGASIGINARIELNANLIVEESSDGSSWSNSTSFGNTASVYATNSFITVGLTRYLRVTLSYGVTGGIGARLDAVIYTDQTCGGASSCPMTLNQNSESACNDNGTPCDPTDDYFTVTFNATSSDGGSTYEVVANAGLDGTGGTVLGTANYGAAITVGNGTNGATGTFLADGSTTYDITIRNAAAPTCHTDYTTTAVTSTGICSLAPGNIMASAIMATCTNDIVNPNTAYLQINNATNATDYSWSQGSVYDAGATIGNSSMTTISSYPVSLIGQGNIPNPTGSQDYTIRLFSASGCSIDVTVTLQNQNCSGYNAFNCTNTVLTNGSFEDGTDNEWITSSSGTAEVVSDAASGTFAYEISDGSGYIYQCAPASAGQSFTLVAAAKRSDGNGGNHDIILEFKGAGGLLLGASSGGVGSSDYQTYYFTGVAPANTIEVCARITKDSPIGTMTVDNICLSQCPAFDAGAIQSDQSYCSSVNPLPIASVSPASGCIGTVTYQWQFKTDVINGYWQNATGITSAAWDNPPASSSTYWTRRLAFCDGCMEVSNIGDVYISGVGVSIESVSITNATCGNNDGSIDITFSSGGSGAGVELSVDGGTTFPYTTTNVGTYAINNLTADSYDVWVRWSNDDCESSVSIETVGDDCGCPNTLLTNGGFEDGTTNSWTTWTSGGGTTSGIIIDAASGSSAYEISGGGGDIYQCVPASAAQEFTLTVAAKRSGPSGGSQDIVLEFKGASGIVLGAQSLAIGSSDYQTYYLTGTAPANTTEVCAKVSQSASTGSIAIDDFCLLQCSDFDAGEIQANQSYCSAATPAPILSISPASGCSGTLTYQWQFKTDLSNGYWQNAIGVTSPTWDNPPFSSTTYWTRRLALCDGCVEISNIGDIFITDNAPIITAISGTNATCDNDDGSITITFDEHPTFSLYRFSIDGGINYDYSSPDDAGSYTITDLAAGTYDTWVRSGSGVCPTDIQDVTIEDGCTTCPTVNPPTSTDETICQGDAIPALSVTANAGLEVDWYDAATVGSLLQANSLTYTPTTPGTYYAETRDPANSCVSATRTAVTLTINDLPTLTIDGATCDANLTTYTIDFTSDGTVASDAGTVIGSQVTDILVGTNANLTATLNSCTRQETVISPTCDPNCPPVKCTKMILTKVN